MKKDIPDKARVDPYSSNDVIVRKAIVLDSERSTTLSLIAGTMKWCRTRMRDIEAELREEHSKGGPVDSTEIVMHLTRLQGLTYKLHSQNAAMMILYDIALVWPAGVEVTVPALSEKL